MHIRKVDKRVGIGWIATLVTLLVLTGCGREPLHQSQAYVFGTLVDISIYGESEERARELSGHVQQEFQRLHRQLHAWQAGSELDRLNVAFAAGKPAAVSPELAGMLADAAKLSEQSGGLFNPAIGHLIQLWGFQRDEFAPVHPDPEEIAKWVNANPRMADIVVENSQAASRNPAVKLDLGGYAKGWALDLAADYLRRQGVKGALVNIGGNIIAIGKHGERPWRVGIQHPRRPGPLATLELPDGWAIGTSGDYQRFFELDGQRYCHIIDPRSGRPAQGVQAVTILVPPGPRAGTLSDVASKPLFISGPADWRKAASTLGIAHALLVDDQGGIHLTQAMKQRLNFTEKNVALEELP
ncbi:MAG TPA: FAD:protein FMN transferase [Methylophilaceae bacterium]|nr:FAD:protein FMN transferase [Methylophilaceae bacterium]